MHLWVTEKIQDRQAIAKLESSNWSCMHQVNKLRVFTFGN